MLYHIVSIPAGLTITAAHPGSRRMIMQNNNQRSIKGGEPVSFEAIASITQAESDAKAAVAQADAKARQMRIDAENAGKAAIEAAAVKADNELAELRRQADE